WRLERSSAERVRYSADVYSYLTTSPLQPVWGPIARAFPKAEGDLFPGLITVTLALVGILFWRGGASPPTRAAVAFLLWRGAAARSPRPLAFRPIHWLLLVLVAAHGLAAVITLFNRR